eukprot:gene21175-biopygen21459
MAGMCDLMSMDRSAMHESADSWAVNATIAWLLVGLSRCISSICTDPNCDASVRPTSSCAISSRSLSPTHTQRAGLSYGDTSSCSWLRDTFRGSPPQVTCFVVTARAAAAELVYVTLTVIDASGSCRTRIFSTSPNPSNPAYRSGGDGRSIPYSQITVRRTILGGRTAAAAPDRSGGYRALGGMEVVPGTTGMGPGRLLIIGGTPPCIPGGAGMVPGAMPAIAGGTDGRMLGCCACCIPDGMECGIVGGIACGGIACGGIACGILGGIGCGIPGGIPGGIACGIPGGIPGGIAGGIACGMPGGIPGGIAGG